MKKLLLTFAALATALALVPMFAAFEAHVVNVTAQIENALSVPLSEIEFGTVFPQEELAQQLDIILSGSFLAEDGVDDVEYIIRQKPKCAWTINNGQTIVGETKSGHVDDAGVITCPEGGDLPFVGSQETPVWGQLPLLCRYLSKHDLDLDDQNDDVGLDAFHEIGQIVENAWVWNDVHGRLAKSQNDTSDSWNIDLKVPCFGGACAQDWEKFVTDINSQADPADYVQDIANEHKVFGCDLWVEVTGVSRVTQPETEGRTASVALENKDESGNWLVIQDETHGTLVYAVASPTFDYTFVAQNLAPNTSYSLIYYADPWPGNNPGALIGSGVTDGSGNIALAGSPNLGTDLPNAADANVGSGAKVWLVLSSDYDAGTKSMTAWNQTQYLFEYNVINYDDTDA